MNSTGVGSIGRTNVVIDGAPTVVDNHVTIIRLRDSSYRPAYVAVYLNSMPGLMQTEKWHTGSSGQIELTPQHIEKFIIPKISAQLQNEIENLVIKSHKHRKQAVATIEKAVASVDEYIEGR